MRGVVKFAAGDLLAVLTEHGEYTVIRVKEDNAVAIGDIVNGPLETLDHQILQNETQGTHLSVYIEDFELIEEDARAKVT